MLQKNSPSRQLVLGSSSRYRRELLERLKLPFETLSPDVDETRFDTESGAECAIRLAQLKARTVAASHPNALVIGSDQVAECSGRRMDKPGTIPGAIEQLTWASGKEAVFNTAVTLLDAASGRDQSRVVATRVRFRSISRDEIERYLQREAAIDCAGSAKVEGLGITLVEAIEGDDPTALIGLPLIALSQMLRNEGIPVP